MLAIHSFVASVADTSSPIYLVNTGAISAIIAEALVNVSLTSSSVKSPDTVTSIAVSQVYAGSIIETRIRKAFINFQLTVSTIKACKIKKKTQVNIFLVMKIYKDVKAFQDGYIWANMVSYNTVTY